MKIAVLTDNQAGSGFLAEHGLSYLIEIDDERILFDSGHSDVFLHNAEKLGFDIRNEIERVVLSHGHWDHGNGLLFLSNKKLITHPGSFVQRFRKKDRTPVNLSFSEQWAKENHHLQLSKKPLLLTSSLIFLGEIPRLHAFESRETAFELAGGEDDFVWDDSAVVAVKNNQLIIVTGCSHAGICNICEYAKKITGKTKIKAVLGGFHLKQQNTQTLETIKYFKTNKVESLYPSHCTELPALALFHQSFQVKAVKTGMRFHF